MGVNSFFDPGEMIAGNQRDHLKLRILQNRPLIPNVAIRQNSKRQISRQLQANPELCVICGCTDYFASNVRILFV